MDHQVRSYTNLLLFVLLVALASCSLSPPGSRLLATIASPSATLVKKLTVPPGKTGTPTPRPVLLKEGKEQLLFARFLDPQKPSKRQDIYTINSDGSGLTQLTDNGLDGPAAWSPDGRLIAFLSGQDHPGNQNPLRLYRANEDGSSQTRVVDFPVYAFSWSPDGQRFALESDGSEKVPTHNIYVINIDGSGLVALTEDGHSTYPAWSPIGKIAFVQQMGGHSVVVLMSPSGKNQIQLTDMAGSIRDLAWSPDGTRIAFYYQEPGVYTFTGGDVYVMNADGTQITRLTSCAMASPKGTCMYPAWSPDGTQIAYVSSAAGNIAGTIYSMSSDGTSQKELINGVWDEITSAAWKP